MADANARDASEVASIIDRLVALQSGQDAINGALGLMIDTLRAQANLLGKLSQYAAEEPASSPVTKVLGELTSAIMELDASIGTMELKFDRLADTLAGAVREEARIFPAPPHTNGGTR
ncbi:hypothetical protein [Acidocella sp.]|uniref:hypothetical protein n=1 Tax=Acidocella sp. TaxID=50710 RepID=UPI003CFBD0D1